MEYFVYKPGHVKGKGINLGVNYNGISLLLLSIFVEYFLNHQVIYQEL